MTNCRSPIIDAWSARTCAEGTSRATVSIWAAGDTAFVPAIVPRSGVLTGWLPELRFSHGDGPRPVSHSDKSPAASLSAGGATAAPATPAPATPAPATPLRPQPLHSRSRPAGAPG